MHHPPPHWYPATDPFAVCGNRTMLALGVLCATGLSMSDTKVTTVGSMHRAAQATNRIRIMRVGRSDRFDNPVACHPLVQSTVD